MKRQRLNCSCRCPCPVICRRRNVYPRKLLKPRNQICPSYGKMEDRTTYRLSYVKYPHAEKAKMIPPRDYDFFPHCGRFTDTSVYTQSYENPWADCYCFCPCTDPKAYCDFVRGPNDRNADFFYDIIRPKMFSSDRLCKWTTCPDSSKFELTPRERCNYDCWCF